MEALKAKLKDNVLIEATTGCWLWQRYCDRHGYGVMKYNKTPQLVHRLSYTAYNGEIPKGLIVRHTCDMPQCCNPEHLLVGTMQDNANDMVERGRSTLGEKHPNAKLTWDAIRAIRSSGESARVLADTYGVSASLIRRILNNTLWVE